MADESPNGIRIELFGHPPRIRIRDNGVVNLEPQPAAILTLLALAPGRPRTREDLIAALWPDEGVTESTHRRLRVALSTLRHDLPGGDLLFPREAQAFHLETDSALAFDVLEFDRLVQQATAETDVVSRAELLSQASEIYAGPLAPRARVAEIVAARTRYEALAADVRRQLAAPESGHDDRNPAPTAARTNPAVLGFWRTALLAASIILIALLGGVVGWKWRSPYHGPAPMTVEQRIAAIVRLRYAIARERSPSRLAILRRQQADQLLPLAEEAWHSWNTPQESAWMDRLAPLYNDIEQNLDWLVVNRPQSAIQLTGALSTFWATTKRKKEARRWLDQVLPGAAIPPSRELARALVLHASLSMEEDDPESTRSRKINQQVLTETGRAHAMYVNLHDRFGQANSLRFSGHVLHLLGRIPAAEDSFQAALKIFRENHQPAWEGYTLWGLSTRHPPSQTPDQGFLWSLDRLVKGVDLLRLYGGPSFFSCAFMDFAHSVWSLDGSPGVYRSTEGERLLRAMMREYRAVIAEPEFSSHLQETFAMQKDLAHLAVLAQDQGTEEEQLGRLLDPYSGSPPRIINSAALCDTYLHFIGRTANPPLSRTHAEMIVREFRKSPRGRTSLSLEEALRIAAPNPRPPVSNR